MISVFATLCIAWSVPAMAPPAGAATPVVTPPSSVAHDCSVDVTSALNAWFSGLASNATVSLPAHACYLVSNSPTTTLRLQALRGVTIDGNGATFSQTSYDDGRCGENVVQPILWLQANDHLAINNVVLRGPGTCGGASNEGDYGLLMGQSGVGNSNVTLDRVTIEYTGGDGLAIMPLLGTGTGINSNIVFENGVLSTLGYHALTLEGVNGLLFTGNAVSGFRNFADLEVDNNCVYTGPTSGCYDSSGAPTSTAQWNVSITGNTFTHATGFGNWIESEQGTCIPQKNLDIENNFLDSSVDGTIVLTGSGSTCPTDTNLTIAGNTSLAPSLSPCGGSIAAPPSCALVEVSDYSSVTISHNSLAAFDGQPGYFPNTLYTPCIALGGVHMASITDNVCNNTLPAPLQVGLQFPPADESVTGLTQCGNTYGLTEPVVPSGAAAAPAPSPVPDGSCTTSGGNPPAPPPTPAPAPSGGGTSGGPSGVPTGSSRPGGSSGPGGGTGAVPTPTTGGAPSPPRRGGPSRHLASQPRFGSIRMVRGATGSGGTPHVRTSGQHPGPHR